MVHAELSSERDHPAGLTVPARYKLALFARAIVNVETVVRICTSAPQKHSHQILEGLGPASKYTIVGRYESKEPSHRGGFCCTWGPSQSRPEFGDCTCMLLTARKRSNCRTRDGHAAPSDGSTRVYCVQLLRGTALYMLTISHI